MTFKDISYLKLWRPFCSVEWIYLCNLLENNSVKLQLSRRRCHFKIFLICSSGGPFVQPSETICPILVESIKRNNSLKVGQEEMAMK